jgi:hypothetical protein
MSRGFAPKIVTANALLSGEVVYLAADGRWSPEHRDAEFLANETLAALRLAFAEAQPDIVVGAYLADAKAGPNGPEPVHFREAFRMRGPSNYFHGKQADSAREDNVSV